jgi:hypothetical protein
MMHPTHANGASPTFAIQGRIWVWVQVYLVVQQCGVKHVSFLVGWVVKNTNTFVHFEV